MTQYNKTPKRKPKTSPKNRSRTPSHSKSKHRSTPSKSSALYPRNVHQGRYDFAVLTKALPELAEHTIVNPNGEPTINFSDREAVLTLNKALLAHHYGVKYWDLPKGYLCPPIPGRADYIHHVADLLAKEDKQGSDVQVLDIGTGANLIYPIVGSQSYGWRFTATDIDPLSIRTAKAIVELNSNLKKLITVKQQQNPNHIFKGVINPEDYFDLTVCNPPFHGSMQDVLEENKRKQSKLRKNRNRRHPNSQLSKRQNEVKSSLNFGGQNAELWVTGGELGFISRMIKESVQFKDNVHWFTTLVSRAENLKALDKLLREVGASEVKTIDMQHGQKKTRILAWRFE